MSKPHRPSQGVLTLPIGSRLKGLTIGVAQARRQKLAMVATEALIDWIAANANYEPSSDAQRYAKIILSKLDGGREAQLVLYPNRETYEAQAHAARGMTWEDHNGLLAETAWILKRDGIAVRFISPESTDLTRLHRSKKLDGEN